MRRFLYLVRLHHAAVGEATVILIRIATPREVGCGVFATLHHFEIDGKNVIFDLQTREAGKTDIAKNVAKNVAKNLTERQQRIIALISENPRTTRAEIAEVLGVAIKTIERDLAALSYIVHYIGSKKSGHWEIIRD